MISASSKSLGTFESKEIQGCSIYHQWNGTSETENFGTTVYLSQFHKSFLPDWYSRLLVSVGTLSIIFLCQDINLEFSL